MTYHGVGPIHRFLFPAVQVHNPPCNGIVRYLEYTCTAHHMGTRYNLETFMVAIYLIAIIHQDEEEVKPGHDGCCQADVLLEEHKTKRDSDATGVEGFVLHRATLSDLVLSYRPPMGLAAAKMEVRALSVALTPALVMEMVCCSMASWMAVWSCGSILSNSSIQHTPWG